MADNAHAKTQQDAARRAAELDAEDQLRDTPDAFTARPLSQTVGQFFKRLAGRK